MDLTDSTLKSGQAYALNFGKTVKVSESNIIDLKNWVGIVAPTYNVSHTKSLS